MSVFLSMCPQFKILPNYKLLQPAQDNPKQPGPNQPNQDQPRPTQHKRTKENKAEVTVTEGSETHTNIRQINVHSSTSSLEHRSDRSYLVHVVYLRKYTLPTYLCTINLTSTWRALIFHNYVIIIFMLIKLILFKIDKLQRLDVTEVPWA